MQILAHTHSKLHYTNISTHTLHKNIRKLAHTKTHRENLNIQTLAHAQT